MHDLRDEAEIHKYQSLFTSAIECIDVDATTSSGTGSVILISQLVRIHQQKTCDFPCKISSRTRPKVQEDTLEQP